MEFNIPVLLTVGDSDWDFRYIIRDNFHFLKWKYAQHLQKLDCAGKR